MLTGLNKENYIVMVGTVVCQIDYDQFRQNQIICEPPLMRPEVSPANYEGYNRIPVEVRVCLAFPFKVL